MPEQPVALGADSPTDNNGSSPSSKVKPLNPNALVWSVEGRVSPAPALAAAQGPQPQQAVPSSQPTHFTPFQGKPMTPPAHHLRPVSPGTIPPPHMASVDEIAAVQLQQEFLHARNVVQVTPRPALVAVLLSLLDDMPHLAATVRYRCERGTAVVTGQSPGAPPMSWGMESAGTTPPSQQRRRSRHRDEEQQELCGIHGSMRALKHLQFNPATGHYECVHGFHCLVDNHNSREGSAAPSNSVTPKKEEKRRTEAAEPAVDVARLQNLLESVRLAHPEQR